MRKSRKRLHEIADLFDSFSQGDSASFHKVENFGPRISYDELEKVTSCLLSVKDTIRPEYKLSLSGIKKKLNHNSLFGNAEEQIREGLMSEDTVHSYLMDKVATLNDNDYPIKVCGCLLSIYNQLHAVNTRGNDLLKSMTQAIVEKIGDVYALKAVTALIAYFFSRCDIFEPYPDEDKDREPTQKKRRRKS